MIGGGDPQLTVQPPPPDGPANPPAIPGQHPTATQRCQLAAHAATPCTGSGSKAWLGLVSSVRPGGRRTWICMVELLGVEAERQPPLATADDTCSEEADFVIRP